MEYDQIRRFVADALERAARAHEGQRYQELAAIFTEVDVPATRGEGSQFTKVGIALNFLDGWVDASNHDWQYHEGIAREDWPRLARIIGTALRTNQDVPVPIVLKHFDLRGSVRDPSILARFKRLLGFGR